MTRYLPCMVGRPVYQLKSSMRRERDLVTTIRSWFSMQAGLSDIARGELGNSVVNGLPVEQVIAEKIWPSVQLAIVALFSSVFIAGSRWYLGSTSAWKPDRQVLDRLR